MICNCQLCRQRNGDYRTNENLRPMEETIPFIERIYSMIGKETQLTVPDTDSYRQIYKNYKSRGFNIKIKTYEIIL